MKTIIRSALMAGTIAVLSACGVIHPEAFNKSAMTAPPAPSASATTFQRSLAQGYSSFGNWEYQQADFRDTKYFFDKAKAAGAGQNVPPTNPSERRIRNEFLTELNPAYTRLTSALATPGALETSAIPLSTAQVYYDCWAEQAEEGFQFDHIAYCKQGFETAMGQLAKPAAAAPAATTARPFLIFFDWDRYNITDSARPTLNEISNTIKANPNANVRIAGHADRSGPDAYNLALSRRRADAVMTALQQQGLQRNRATVEYFGEARPLVETADGVREPQNRRVEVTISR
jgi:outer membrane protein OmpA-like peptidoglycan-associated protein